jgi:hypothetical protein
MKGNPGPPQRLTLVPSDSGLAGVFTGEESVTEFFVATKRPDQEGREIHTFGDWQTDACIVVIRGNTADPSDEDLVLIGGNRLERSTG